MAISATHYLILRELKQRGVLPQGGSILEIGQANWYGDMDPAEILSDILILDPGKVAAELSVLYARLFVPQEHPLVSLKGNLFEAASLIYGVMFCPSSITAIDGDPAAPNALKYDLNTFEILTEDGLGTFSTVINHGTAEHIFNIANVFRVMHEATKPGGLMIHEAPFTGWVDHGFYCVQPTLFWDVAAANGYQMVGVWVEHLASRSYFPVESREALLERRKCDQLPDNAMLFVAMRKAAEESSFRVPMQGVYVGAVSSEATQAWRELR